MSFQAIYDSPWHSPVFFVAVGVVFLVALMLSRRSQGAWLFRFVFCFTVAIMIDALLTGAWAPVSNGALATAVSVFFVILGDLRFFALVERFARTKPTAAWGAAIGWSFIVPVTAHLFSLVSPSPSLRITFLRYELMFLMLAIVVRVLVPRRLERAQVSPEVRAWLSTVASFEIAQYGLWALSDVLILGGLDFGYGARLIPNSLYYAFFLPFVWWKAPAEVRA